MTASFAVIFDNDGVLVDSEHYSILAYRRAIEEQGVELVKEDDERYCGLTDADIVRDMTQRYSRDLDLEKFSERKRLLYLEIAGTGEMNVFPGARELLEQLRETGVPYALASSGSREKIAFNLKRADLSGLVPVVVSGEDFHRGKPDPEIFLKAAEKLTVAPNRCIVFEDSINGLKAARAAGMIAVGVANTFSKERLTGFSDHVITSLEQVNPAVLENWALQA